MTSAAANRKTSPARFAFNCKIYTRAQASERRELRARARGYIYCLLKIRLWCGVCGDAEQREASGVGIVSIFGVQIVTAEIT